MCFLSKKSALKVRFSFSFVEKNVENSLKIQEKKCDFYLKKHWKNVINGFIMSLCLGEK